MIWVSCALGSTGHSLDLTDIDSYYLKKTSVHQLLSICMQMDVSHMSEGISPQWHLLKYHLCNLGPGYHAVSAG